MHLYRPRKVGKHEFEALMMLGSEILAMYRTVNAEHEL